MLSSNLNETQPTHQEEMSILDSLPLISLEDLAIDSDETWLYVLGSRQQRVTFTPKVIPPSVSNLNATINLKETSYYLDNVHSENILLRDVQVIETVSELEQTKIIDTRTFTRPRKGKMTPSPVKPVVQPVKAQNTNLNSTFDFKSSVDNGCDVMNETVVIQETKLGTTQADLNATFPVDANGPTEQEPCNNNVYNLNSTFQAQPATNRTQMNTTQTKAVLNATYDEQELVEAPETPRNSSLDDLDEIDDETFDADEVVFRKPLIPGAVPKRPLIRTSTWKVETPESPPPKQSSPPAGSGLAELEKCAKMQEEILAQTSTPMGHQRRPAALRRAAEVEHHLGSPISNPAETTVNYGPPIPLREPLCGHGNSDSSNLDSSSNGTRGQLTFEKSHNSIENHSNSPSSQASSPYSSQSLESESTGSQPTTQELIRRSMPNLNNVTRLRMPQPTAITSNLNRQHGSDSGLRPPSFGSGIRPPAGSAVNGALVRPSYKLPQPQNHAASQPSVNSAATQLQRPASRTSMLPSASKLKPPQLPAPRAALPAPSRLAAPSVRAPDALNSTVVMSKPAPAPASGIPRPGLTRIPMPRTAKSSIPTMGARPRAPPM